MFSLFSLACYMGSPLEDLHTNVAVWLISVCIIINLTFAFKGNVNVDTSMANSILNVVVIIKICLRILQLNHPGK